MKDETPPKTDEVCAFCRQAKPIHDLTPAELVRPSLHEMIRRDCIDWDTHSWICYADLHRYTARLIENMLTRERGGRGRNIHLAIAHKDVSVTSKAPKALVFVNVPLLGRGYRSSSFGNSGSHRSRGMILPGNGWRVKLAAVPTVVAGSNTGRMRLKSPRRNSSTGTVETKLRPSRVRVPS